MVGLTKIVALEGEYSSYTALWKQAYDAAESDNNFLVSTDESLGLIFIRNLPYDYLTTRKLSDGTNPTVTLVLDDVFPASDSGFLAQSVLRKYFAFSVNEGGKPKLKIYKSGALLQTIDLTLTPIEWTTVTINYYISMSPDGKYIFVNNNFNNEYALFEGS